MKKTNCRIVAFLVLVMLLVPLLSTTAFAAVNIDATVGQKLWWCVAQSEGTNDENSFGYAEIISGSCPGISVGFEDDCVYLTGTPTAAGTYNMTVLCQYKDTYDEMVTVCINVAAAPKTYSGTVYISQGKPVSNTTVTDCHEMIQSSSLVSGSLPAGITASQYDTYFAISGTATKSGSYSATYYCETEGDPCYMVLNINVAAVEVKPELKVTKSPSHETCTEGESALFISAAENYSQVEWRIVTKDGNNCWRHSSTLNEITSGFPGVKVSAYQGKDGREYLELSNIPLSLNGYYVQTKFWSTDKSETAFTDDKSCLLTVEKAEPETPVISTQPAEAEETIGEAPAAEPSPAASETPVTAVTEPSPVPEVTTSPEPEEEEASTDPILYVIAVLLVALVAVGTAVLFKLKRKPRREGGHSESRH